MSVGAPVPDCDVVRSESQLLGRFFLNDEEPVAGLYSADAAKSVGESACADWFICGAEWPA